MSAHASVYESARTPASPARPSARPSAHPSALPRAPDGCIKSERPLTTTPPRLDHFRWSPTPLHDSTATVRADASAASSNVRPPSLSRTSMLSDWGPRGNDGQRPAAPGSPPKQKQDVGSAPARSRQARAHGAPATSGHKSMDAKIWSGGWGNSSARRRVPISWLARAWLRIRRCALRGRTGNRTSAEVKHGFMAAHRQMLNRVRVTSCGK